MRKPSADLILAQPSFQFKFSSSSPLSLSLSLLLFILSFGGPPQNAHVVSDSETVLLLFKNQHFEILELLVSPAFWLSFSVTRIAISEPSSRLRSDAQLTLQMHSSLQISRMTQS
jgi:hypothetical protein